MYKNFYRSVIFGVFIAIIQSQNAFAQTCAIQSGPIPEMIEYAKSIDTELSKLLSEASKQEKCSSYTQKASLVFDAAYSDISAMEHTFTDFSYYVKVAAKGETAGPIRRDENFFPQIEKKIERTAEQLATQCGLNSNNRRDLHALILEVNTFKKIYQETTLGKSPTQLPKNIRSQNEKIFHAITSAYSPNQTIHCQSNSPKQKDFAETLKNAINIGGKMEDSLSTWRKAIALIRGGGKGLASSEYIAIQRRLLEAELNRQGLSQNTKDVILKNFDCYKAKTTLSSDPENALSARVACLQFPVAGVDKMFTEWRNFRNTSKTTDELSSRTKTLEKRQSRAVDVVHMYNILSPMISTEQDINQNTQKGLIDLHISLQSTNDMLEKRISPMQNNCMKGQPDIVGGCR